MRELPVGWLEFRLGEITSFASGFGFSDRFQGNRQGELPFFKVSDMSALGNERHLTHANHYVARELAVAQRWKVVPPHAVAFAKVGAALMLNRRRMTVGDSLIDNNMLSAVAGDGVDPTWLYWWFQTVDFGVFVQPGVVPSVNQSQLSALAGRLPPVAEQRQIAAILDTIDDAIRKTEQIIAKLKQVKQGLLHDLLSCGIDDNGELRDPERQPEQFKDSPLGRIPKGWEATALRQCLIGTPTNGIYKPASMIGRGTLLVGQTAVTAERSIDPSLARRAVVGRAEIERYGLSEGDVLVSRVFATVEGVGQPALVPQLPEPAVYESNMMRLRIDRTVIRPELLFEWLRSTGFRLVLEARVNASNQASINQRGLNSLPIGLPGAPEQERIVGTLASVDRRRRDEEAGVNKLHLLKRGLMHDLLIGRVRVTKLLENARS